MIHARPIPVTERIAELDALRGFALLGVALANLGTFSGYVWLGAAEKAGLSTASIDGTLHFLTDALLDGKFYTLFSLLFGIGFAVQLQRASTRDTPFAPLFRRRLWVLMGIGLLHLLLLWFGDILTTYALCGFGLLAVRKASDRALLIWAGVLIALPVVQYLAMWALFEPDNPARMALANPGIMLMPAIDS